MRNRMWMDSRRGRAWLSLAVVAAALAAGCSAPAGPAFGPPITVAETGGSRPTVAVAPGTGAVYVAWVGTADGVSNVLLARLDPGENRFAAPVRVNDVPGDAAPHQQAPAQVAVGPGGNVYVAWQNNMLVPGRRFPASDLRFARSTDGGRTFEPAIYVNDDAGADPSSHTFHNLAVGGDGTVYVSWIDSRVRSRQMAAAHAGGVGEDAGHAAPGPEIRLARSRDGGRSFGPSLVVDRDACPCCRTALAAAADGTVYVAWRKVFDGDVRDIVIGRLDAGANGFDAPVRVHADHWVFHACPHAGPAIALDGEGRVHVGWYTGREGAQGLYYAVSADGGRSFGEPDPLLVGEWVPPSQIALAAGEDGGIRIAWDDRRTVDRTLQLARVPAGDTAPIPQDAVLAGAAPAIAAAAGVRAITWIEHGAVRAAVAPPPAHTPPDPPLTHP